MRAFGPQGAIIRSLSYPADRAHHIAAAERESREWDESSQAFINSNFVENYGTVRRGSCSSRIIPLTHNFACVNCLQRNAANELYIYYSYTSARQSTKQTWKICNMCVCVDDARIKSSVLIRDYLLKYYAIYVKDYQLNRYREKFRE